MSGSSDVGSSLSAIVPPAADEETVTWSIGFVTRNVSVCSEVAPGVSVAATDSPDHWTRGPDSRVGVAVRVGVRVGVTVRVVLGVAVALPLATVALAAIVGVGVIATAGVAVSVGVGVSALAAVAPNTSTNNSPATAAATRFITWRSSVPRRLRNLVCAAYFAD